MLEVPGDGGWSSMMSALGGGDHATRCFRSDRRATGARAFPSRLEFPAMCWRGFRNAPDVRFVGLRLTVTGGNRCFRSEAKPTRRTCVTASSRRRPPYQRGERFNDVREHAGRQRPKRVVTQRSPTKVWLLVALRVGAPPQIACRQIRLGCRHPSGGSGEKSRTPPIRQSSVKRIDQ